jgi:D-alanyl-D-alanine carboxypeptidase
MVFALVFLACRPVQPGNTIVVPVPDSDSDVSSNPYADFSASLSDVRSDRGVPGLAGSAVSSADILTLGASGQRVRKFESDVEWTDKWHLGSNTKAMTATLVAIHVERGTFLFESTLPELFPSIDTHDDYVDVTLEMLLSHSAGLTGNLGVSDPELWADLWAAGTDVVPARAALATALLSKPPAQAPGTPVYANAGFILAGAALEQATGEAWETLISDDLFTPLGMTDCGFGPPLDDANLYDQPWGHSTNGNGKPVGVSPEEVGADNPPALGPAGTVHCSMESWSRFAQANLSSSDGQALLTEASWERLHTRHAGDYALGWGVVDGQPWAQGAALTHTGSNTLWMANVWLAPAIDRGYLAATNWGTTEAFNATNDVVLALLEDQP